MRLPDCLCVFVADRIPADSRLHARRGQKPVLQRQVRQSRFLISPGMKRSKTFTPSLSARRCWISSDTHLLYIIHGPICAALLVGSHSPALTCVWAVASWRGRGGRHLQVPGTDPKGSVRVRGKGCCCVRAGGRWGRSSVLQGRPW